MYDLRGDTVNTKTLYPRRPSSKDRLEFNEDKFVKSLKVAVNQDKRNEATLSWSDMGYGNVASVALKNGDNTIMSGVVNSTKFAKLSTSSLTPDIDYNDTYIEYQLIDGTVKQVSYPFTTKLSIFGTLEDVTFKDSNKGYVISFKKMTLRDEVEAVKVYANDVYVGDVKEGARNVIIPWDALTEEENVIKLVTVVGDKEYLIDEFIYEQEVVPTKYTISYDLDGGLFNGEAVTEFTAGENVTLLTPVKEGYEFLGWYQGDEKVETITDKNYELVAKWKKIEEQTEPDPVTPPVVEPVAPDPVEEKKGCNKAAILELLSTIMLLSAILFIRKKH